MEMSRMTMASLANWLTPFLDRPVVDGTGLKGAYQIALDLPYESMISVIQNLAGAGGFQGGFPGFPGGGSFGGGLAILAECREVAEHRIPQLRCFKLFNSSASNCSLARPRWTRS